MAAYPQKRTPPFQVFLKYYHVELLSRQFEQQLRKVVLVQALCRRWLAARLVKRLREKNQSKVQVMHPCEYGCSSAETGGRPHRGACPPRLRHTSVMSTMM